jgi:hypothetical protein
MGALPLLVPDSKDYNYINNKVISITFKENGYLIIRGTGYVGYLIFDAFMAVYRDSTLSTCVGNYSCKGKTNTAFFPVDAGTYYIRADSLTSFYLGFVPASSSCELSAREQKNKSIYVDIKDIERKTKIIATALDGTKSAYYCNTSSWLEGDYECSVKDNVATILLPEPGKYTIMVDVEFNENCHNRFVYQIDTKELLADAKKMETPISILAGTNAIIGQAKPNATIYATVNGTDYSTKADSNGIYRLKVGKLKKKKSIKMWQVENGKTTAEGTFKVVNKY